MNFNFILTGLFIVSAQLVARVLLVQSTNCDINFDYKCYIMVALYDLMTFIGQLAPKLTIITISRISAMLAPPKKFIFNYYIIFVF